MFDTLSLLYFWLPTGIRALVMAFIHIFVLAFFLHLLLRLVEIIRG